MEKKGISPLIATVLLIGFTIVLAAVVMRWGGEFVRETTEETTCIAEAATACIDLRSEITNAVDNAPTTSSVTVTISSSSDQVIDGFRILLWQETTTAATEEFSDSGDELQPYETLTYEITYQAGSIIDRVEAFPIITVEDCPSETCQESGIESTL